MSINLTFTVTTQMDKEELNSDNVLDRGFIA